MIISWGDYSHQVSWGYNKKCGFFIIGQFFWLSHYYFLRLYFTLTCTSGWDNHIAKEGVANHAQKEYQGIKNEAKDSENNRKSY